MNLLTKLVGSLLGTGLMAGGIAAYAMHKQSDIKEQSRHSGIYSGYLANIDKEIESSLDLSKLSGKRTPKNAEDWQEVAKKQSQDNFIPTPFQAQDFCKSAISHEQTLIEKCTL